MWTFKIKSEFRKRDKLEKQKRLKKTLSQLQKKKYKNSF